MTHGQFFETLDYRLVDGKVHISAGGPKAKDDNIKEICVWIFQRSGDDDAAATEMTTIHPEAFDPHPTETSWSLEIGQIKDKEEAMTKEIPFHPGAAVALAVALVEFPKKTDAGEAVLEGGQPKVVQKVLLWSQSIDLREQTGTSSRPAAQTSTSETP
jgi:hypothetical protein